MFKSIKGRAAAGVSILAILAIAFGVGVAQGLNRAHADDTASARAEKIKVGTYEFEQVLRGYHETQKFLAFVQGLEQEAQAAQEAQNFQRLMELQFEAQSREQQLMESFNAAIDEHVPDVAKRNNLKAVATELVYFADDVEPEDITAKIIEAINEGADVPAIVPDFDDQDDDDDQE